MKKLPNIFWTDPKQGITDEEIEKLSEFGYAPGMYLHSRCSYCEEEYTADKRAHTCRECAEKLAAKPKILKVGEFTDDGFPVGWEFEGFKPRIFIPTGTWLGSSYPDLLKIMKFCGYTAEELRKFKQDQE